ncbi:hypothetical protein CYY_003308 [Polysphondylium violaceum]|uniref:Paramecium surface antigen repeat-containing protein n=1 Tax=Polysphondylium violaceum TaxID=133409 RepID=A0A8J4PZX0_9MYCE|nr:hypothetical protein CYY_003308 [Polysphondylium violaceum]
MKKIILSILLIAICFTQYSSARLVCGDKTCGVDGAYCLSSAACGPNYFCEKKHCVASKPEGSICRENKECEMGLNCINDGRTMICRNTKYAGKDEDCKKTYNCMGNLKCVSGKCVSSIEQECKFHEDCHGSQYCRLGVCSQKLALGASCNVSLDVCENGFICGHNASSIIYDKGNCMPLFSKQNGDGCYSQFGECDMANGLICPATNGLVSSCQEQGGIQACSSNNDCDSVWETCECDHFARDATCTLKFHLEEQCKSSYHSFIQCAKENDCPITDIHKTSNLNSKSCLFKHCAQETSCFYASCLKKEFECGLPIDKTCPSIENPKPRLFSSSEKEPSEEMDIDKEDMVAHPKTKGGSDRNPEKFNSTGATTTASNSFEIVEGKHNNSGTNTKSSLIYSLLALIVVLMIIN